jgi:transposase InsO family protein
VKQLGRSDISLSDVKEYLASQPAYTKFRPARRRYPRNPITATYCGDVFQIDIMDMQKHVKENDGYKYAVLGYDTYSKFLAAEPIKDRTPHSVITALDAILTKLPFQLRNIYWDREGSFLSKAVQAWLESREISNYTTTSQVKAPNVERAIRTIRTYLARVHQKTSSWRWLQPIQTFVSNYNNRPHSTTKQRPLDVVVDPAVLLQSGNNATSSHPMPPAGSFVRISTNRGQFGKESKGTWSSEIFKVAKVRETQPIAMAELQDLTGEGIQGSFYPYEVQEIEWDEAKKQPETIHKTQTRGKTKRYLVSFVGWPAKHLEWVDEAGNVVL